MSQGTFSEAFERIFFLRPKIDFSFQGVSPGFLVKK